MLLLLLPRELLDNLHTALQHPLQQLHAQQQLADALETVLNKVVAGFGVVVGTGIIRSPQTSFTRSLSVAASEVAEVLKRLLRDKLTVDGESGGSTHNSNNTESLQFKLGKIPAKHLQLTVDTVAAILQSFPKCKSNSFRASFVDMLGSCAVLLQHAITVTTNKYSHKLTDVKIPHVTIQEATTPIMNRKNNKKTTKTQVEMQPLLSDRDDQHNSASSTSSSTTSSVSSTTALTEQLASCMTVSDLIRVVTDVLRQFLRECAEGGVYQSTEELIVATASSLHDISQVTDEILQDILLDLLDSKGQYQKSGACKAFCNMTSVADIDKLKHCLLQRLKGHGSANCEKEAAMILIHLGHRATVLEVLLQQLDPRSYTPPLKISNAHLQVIVDVLVHMQAMTSSDRETREQVIRSLSGWIQRAEDDNWLKMEVVQSIERLGYYDNRLINTLDICLRTESHAVNALGLREASVHALQTFKVPPNGRPCFEIFWVDKLQRGRSKLCRVFAFLLGMSLLLFPILFFSLLYGQIVSMNRAIETTGHITDIAWQYKWSACGESGICYEGSLQIEYKLKNPKPSTNTTTATGTAMVYCATPIGAMKCQCCEQYIQLYRDNIETKVWYDPYDLHTVFIKRELDGFAWRNALFHTLFWPLLLAFFPLITMWPYMWYAWDQSRREKGLPPTFCHKLSRSPTADL